MSITSQFEKSRKKQIWVGWFFYKTFQPFPFRVGCFYFCSHCTSFNSVYVCSKVIHAYHLKNQIVFSCLLWVAAVSWPWLNFSLLILPRSVNYLLISMHLFFSFRHYLLMSHCKRLGFIGLLYPRHISIPLLSPCAILCLVAQSCPALCDPMDCSPPGSSIVGFFRQGY